MHSSGHLAGCATTNHRPGEARIGAGGLLLL